MEQMLGLSTSVSRLSKILSERRAGHEIVSTVIALTRSSAGHEKLVEASRVVTAASTARMGGMPAIYPTCRNYYAPEIQTR